MKEAERLRKEVIEEFNRQIPEEYFPLIARAKGEGKNDLGHRNDTIFFKIDNPVAQSVVYLATKNEDNQNAWRKEQLKEWRERVSGKDFIDLGCGNPEFPYVFRLPFKSVSDFVKSLGAKRYVGIDLHGSPQFDDFTQEVNDFKRIYIPNKEVLEFLATIPNADKHSTGKVLFLSGLESMFRQEDLEDLKFIPDVQLMHRYHQALYNEMGRITKSGDSVYLGGRTKSFESFELVKRGFVGEQDFKEGQFCGHSEGPRIGFYVKK